MCFLSFLVTQKGELYFGLSLYFHDDIANGWKLKYVQYREAEWIGESEASLSVRIEPNDKFDENYYKSLILKRYPNRTALLKSITIGHGYNGSRAHYINGQRHRINNPAIIYPNGYVKYYEHDQLHRLNGPAVFYSSGYKEYWEYGKFIKAEKPTKPEYHSIV